MAGTAEDIKVRVTAKGAQAERELRKVEKRTDSLGVSLKGVAIAVAGSAGVAMAFRKMSQVSKVFISNASDLAESQNAVNVVFGESAKIISEFGDVSVNAVGLATSEFNSLATVVGAQLKQTGLDMDTVAAKTIELTQRAADTASIFNVDVKEALEAYGAVLRGESEPARRFAVSISDAAVRAEALASGLVQSKDEITEQVKVQARFNLIMKQSSDYAGDFANTSESFSNQLKIAKSNVENLSASLGEQLIPTASAVVSTFNNMAEEILRTRQQFMGLKDSIDAENEGTASLDQQLQVLLHRRERYTGLTERQKEALDAEIQSLRDQIAIRDSNVMSIEDAIRAREEYNRIASAAPSQSAEPEVSTDSADAAAAEAERLAEVAEAERFLAKATAETEQARRDQMAATANYQAERYYTEQDRQKAERDEEKERHLERMTHLQEELQFYSNYASGVGNMFSNLISSMTAGDEELSDKKKKQIIALFNMQKAANIAQIGMDTATGIMRATVDPGGLKGIALGALIGGMGITQLAVAAAAKPPVALAEGGIVSKTPGGVPAIIGEGRYDEAVVPLKPGMSMGNTYYINVSGVVGDAQEVAVAIHRAMKLAEQTGAIEKDVAA